MNQNRYHSGGQIKMTERHDSLDLMRGFALLGLPLMNIISFSMPAAAYLNPTVHGTDTWLDHFIFGFLYVFADQKFMGLFSLLFGASIILLAEKSEGHRRSAASVHYRRTFWLIVIGFCHYWYLWEGDVLLIYAGVALLIYPLKNLNPQILLIIFALFMYWSGALFHSDQEKIETLGAVELEEINKIFSPTSDQIQKEIDIYTGSYKDIVEYIRNFGETDEELNHSENNAEEFKGEAGEEVAVDETESKPLSEEVDGINETNDVDNSEDAGSADEYDDEYQAVLADFFLAVIFRVIAMMCLGMALFKLGILQARRPTNVYQAIFLVGVIIGLPITLWGLWLSYDGEWQVATMLDSGLIFHHVGLIFFVPAYIGLIVLWSKSKVFLKLKESVQAVGKLALTNYLMQSVMCAFIFYGYGLGLFSSMSRTQVLFIAILVSTIQLFYSTYWVKKFQYGPVEWLLRTLTYFKLQPVLIKKRNDKD